MATLIKVVPKEYRDSVSLMQLSAMLAKLPGVEQASAVMATENNLALLTEAGFGVGTTGASASDLLVVVQGEASALPAAIEEAVSCEVLSAALFARFRSRRDHTFAERVLSAMRFQFGGHVERPA